MLRLVLACLTLCFSYNIALAKYCVKLPSCEELGYVFPYKEGRRQIRCPFDTDKALYLDYCQAYGIQGKPDEKAGEYQECIEEKADGTKINTGYYRYTRCNVGYTYQSGQCIKTARTQYAVGDIYYHNGTAIGVVFFDDGTTTKIVALHNIDENGENSSKQLYWTTSNGNDYYDIPNLTNHEMDTAITDMDGKTNTSIILSYASANGKTVQAATATRKYAPSVCSGGTICAKGNWYLPAMGELWTMYNNLSTVDNALNNARGTKLTSALNDNTACFFWSSTETPYPVSAWDVGFNGGYKNGNPKYLDMNVRPVLAF